VDPGLQVKATSYLHAMLDQERPLKLSWYSKWAVHAGKPSSMLSLYKGLVTLYGRLYESSGVLVLIMAHKL
jgi:hypothetical protein